MIIARATKEQTHVKPGKAPVVTIYLVTTEVQPLLLRVIEINTKPKSFKQKVRKCLSSTNKTNILYEYVQVAVTALIKFTLGTIQIKSLILNVISLDYFLFERVLMVEEP